MSESSDGSKQTRDSDITTARGFYEELLAFEDGMEGAAAFIRNRGRWLEAIRHLQQARTALEQFIGERITADIRQAHETAQSARLADIDDSDDTNSVGGDA